MRDRLKASGIIALTFGFLWAALSCPDYIDYHDALENGLRTEAKVVDIKAQSRKGSMHWTYEFEYLTKEGKKTRGTYETSTAISASYPVGSTASIAYERKRPDRAFLIDLRIENGFHTKFIMAGVVGIAGLVLLAGARFCRRSEAMDGD